MPVDASPAGSLRRVSPAPIHSTHGELREQHKTHFVRAASLELNGGILDASADHYVSIDTGQSWQF